MPSHVEAEEEHRAVPEQELEELRDALPLPPREAARALYEQYKRRRGRWESYGHLLGFLAFVSVYLAVLYMQRNAQISYTVHATIKDTIVPSDPVMTSSSDILNWLRGTLERVWKDPVCGDGLCEEPFEFASYGRFGCRADCGDLGALQDLTTVLVDLEFDFRHPVGSVPSTELMKQASWNLCPRHGAPHGLDCYWTSDEEFTRLSGEVHVEITDMPDGDWILVIRRDIFNKVSGAVRAKEALHEDAAAKKIELAAIAADLGREVEVRQMELAVSIGDMSNEEVIADYLNATWEAYRSNITLQNSTGAFSTNGSYNATRFQAWTAELHPFKLDESSSVRYLNVSQLLPGEYVIGASAHAYWYQATHECRNITEIYDASSVFADASSSPVCQLFRQITEAAFARRLQMHRAAIGDRLFVANDEMGFKLGNLSAELAATQPELMAVIASLSGDDPGSFPMQASMRSLAGFYLEPIRGSEPPPPFKSQLSKAALNRLPSSGREEEAESFRQVKVRIQARLAELGSIRDKMESLPEVKAVRAYLAGKNISAATYNYLTFSGGQDAYMTTNLTLRAPQYSGECRQDVPVEQTFATDPISNLTYLKTSVPDINSGFMRFVDLAGCRELCVCEKSACSGGSAVTTSGGDGSYTATYCECSVCVLELKDPTQDDQFVEVKRVFLGDSIEAAERQRARRRLASMDPKFALQAHHELLHLKHAARRRLQQRGVAEPEVELLSKLITDIGSMSRDQTSLGTTVAALEAAVTKAGNAQEARAADNTVAGLIAAGRADIASGHQRVDALLREIVEKQTSAAAAAEAMAAAVQQAADLAARIIQSQQAVEKNLQRQLQAISVAVQNRVITLADALTLWRKARLDRLKAMKRSLLMNMQTSNYTAVAYPFKLQRYNSTPRVIARERYIGTNNRIIAGMLLHTTRTTPVDCPPTRFNSVENVCAGPLDARQYGVDPVFKQGSSLYNPDLDNNQTIASYYNCSRLRIEPTYNVEDPFNPGTFTNQYPNCAELINMRGIPWGFHHFPMDYFERGYPVWFDINLNEQDAMRFYNYVEEGLYLDGHTRDVNAQVVTYNGELRVFASTMITFAYRDGGSIDVSYKLDTTRVELYVDGTDRLRLCLEIFITLSCLVSLLAEIWEMITIWRESGSPSGYFASAWNYIDLLSIGLNWSTVCMWWIFVLNQGSTFDIDLRYDVYHDFTAPAGILRLAGEGDNAGEGLLAVQAAFAELQRTVDSLTIYYAINAINVLLLLARALKLMDFQPRLGIVTRSLTLAGADLTHFIIVSGMVFMGFAMMAHLIFGSNIARFASFASSCNVCFEILLGDISVNSELRDLPGLQGVTGQMFFWTFELLVFMVLLNFLLAIIVDAFSEIKENTPETTSIHTEIAQILSDKWRRVMACFGRRQHVTNERLGQLLKVWGGETQEEQEPESAEKTLKILNTKVGSEELAGILKRCLAEARDRQKMILGDHEKKGFGLGFGGRDAMPTDEDIDNISELVVDRFGKAEHSEDEEDGEDEQQEEEAVQTKMPGRQDGEKEVERARNSLAFALDRLSDIQRQLSEGQQRMVAGQKHIQSQYGILHDLLITKR